MTDISREAPERIWVQYHLENGMVRTEWFRKFAVDAVEYTRSDLILTLRDTLDKAEETIRESALQYLSDTGQLMEQIAHLKEREGYLVDLLDLITDHQAVIDCLTLQELNEVSGAMAEYTKGVKDDLGT